MFSKRSVPGQPANIPQATASPDDIVLRLDEAPISRCEDARVTLVEVSDFEYPFCGRYARETEPLILKEYVDAGKIHYAFVHRPIAARHKNAFPASEAAACAGDQGQYWPMHRRLFANQAAIAPIHLPIHAQLSPTSREPSRRRRTN